MTSTSTDEDAVFERVVVTVGTRSTATPYLITALPYIVVLPSLTSLDDELRFEVVVPGDDDDEDLRLSPKALGNLLGLVADTLLEGASEAPDE